MRRDGGGFLFTLTPPPRDLKAEEPRAAGVPRQAQPDDAGPALGRAGNFARGSSSPPTSCRPSLPTRPPQWEWALLGNGPRRRGATTRLARPPQSGRRHRGPATTPLLLRNPVWGMRLDENGSGEGVRTTAVVDVPGRVRPWSAAPVAGDARPGGNDSRLLDDAAILVAPRTDAVLAHNWQRGLVDRAL